MEDIIYKDISIEEYLHGKGFVLYHTGSFLPVNQVVYLSVEETKTAIDRMGY